MRTPIRIVPIAAAIFAVFVLPGQAAATTVDQFLNHMTDGQQSDYIQTMARAAEASLRNAGKPELARRVETLFSDSAKQNDGGGFGEYLKAVDDFLREEIVREVGDEKSKDSPFLVEEMMVRELQNHQIVVPPSFMAAARAGKLGSARR